MTLVSTVLAMGFMPLNMFLYLRQWTDENVRIPFIQNALIILMTWIPVFIGLFIRHKSVKVATWIANVGHLSGHMCMLMLYLISFSLEALSICSLSSSRSSYRTSCLLISSI
jgi:sodium/bile acid cotransporter 2